MGALTEPGPHAIGAGESDGRERPGMQVPNSPRFKHVVFPREACRPGGVNLARFPSPRAQRRKAAELPPAQAQFLSWLFAQAGLDVDSYRVETLDRRLPACLRLLHAQNVGEARQRLE